MNTPEQPAIPLTQYRCRICNSITTNPRHVAEYSQSLRCADYLCDGPVEPASDNKVLGPCRVTSMFKLAVKEKLANNS